MDMFLKLPLPSVVLHGEGLMFFRSEFFIMVLHLCFLDSVHFLTSQLSTTCEE
jgi:hypothetical protein